MTLTLTKNRMLLSAGFSEERAVEIFGEDNVDVYHSEFSPLEYSLPHKSSRCYAKLIVNNLDKQRVIGFHYRKSQSRLLKYLLSLLKYS